MVGPMPLTGFENDFFKILILILISLFSNPLILLTLIYLKKSEMRKHLLPCQTYEEYDLAIVDNAQIRRHSARGMK